MDKDYTSEEFFAKVDSLYEAAYNAVKDFARVILTAVADKASTEARNEDGTPNLQVAAAILEAGTTHVERTLSGLITEVGISLAREAVTDLVATAGEAGEDLAKALGIPEDLLPDEQAIAEAQDATEDAQAAAAVIEAERILYEAGE